MLIEGLCPQTNGESMAAIATSLGAKFARLELSLHPVSTVLGGFVLFSLDDGHRVLRAFRDWAAGLPDEASMVAAVITAPPEPFVPVQIVGQKMVGVIGCWCGDLDRGAAVLAELSGLFRGDALFAQVGGGSCCAGL